ncbi:MAG: hypothetical protein LQ337_002101 [Flavoplaca oasis]|nr:MAG: hypothetical protein LQ337_002101 [Flavoplaca oasis]
MGGLKIDSAPFRPSLLRNHYTPRSPVSPLESVAKRVCSSLGPSAFDSASISSASTNSLSSDPPPSPQKWIWRCHECHTTYQIGITRRCLVDDHELCYGQPIKKRSKKTKKKTRACQSQFDYTGWQAWGAWKRSAYSEREIERNCAAICDWPSQCRWNHSQEKLGGPDCSEHAAEATSQTPETETCTNEEAPTQSSKTKESLISKIGTATQKLTLQWTSMLKPIEEKPSLPDMAAIEDFLNSATTPTETSHPLASDQIPFVAPLAVIKATSTNQSVHHTRSKADDKTSVFGLGLGLGCDFGFHPKADEVKAKPSLTTGYKDLVNGTISIAMSTPSRCRRCVSEPPTQSEPLQGQPQERRRVSMG